MEPVETGWLGDESCTITEGEGRAVAHPQHAYSLPFSIRDCEPDCPAPLVCAGKRGVQWSGTAGGTECRWVATKMVHQESQHPIRGGSAGLFRCDQPINPFGNGCAFWFVLQLWQHLYHGQADWAKATNTPPLLANLGVSLIERAVLDALCRHLETPLHQAVQKNLLGIRFGEVRPELERVLPENLFGKSPLDSIHIRHTIGLGDPLTAEDVPADEQLNDGLPYTLEENIRAYGLSYFKIKVRGDRDADLNRLRKIRRCPRNERELINRA